MRKCQVTQIFRKHAPNPCPPRFPSVAPVQYSSAKTRAFPCPPPPTVKSPHKPVPPGLKIYCQNDHYKIPEVVVLSAWNVGRTWTQMYCVLRWLDRAWNIATFAYVIEIYILCEKTLIIQHKCFWSSESYFLIFVSSNPPNSILLIICTFCENVRYPRI